MFCTTIEDEIAFGLENIGLADRHIQVGDQVVLANPIVTVGGALDAD